MTGAFATPRRVPEYFQGIANNPQVGEFEDWRVLVSVDRNNCFRALHANCVLHRPLMPNAR